MSRTWKYRSGDWNVICDICGKKIKSSLAKHRWDGFIVCPEDYEHRHPQDFIKTKADRITIPWSRPIGQEVFIDVNYILPLECTPLTSTAEVDECVADCARADIKLMGDL